MTKWIVSTPLKGTDLMKNFVCFTEVELRKLLEQYPDASVEMKDSHLEDHAPLPLNDDQQIVLEWLKEQVSIGSALQYVLWEFTDNVYEEPAEYSVSEQTKAWLELTEQEQYQVLAVFADWRMKEVGEV